MTQNYSKNWTTKFGSSEPDTWVFKFDFLHFGTNQTRITHWLLPRMGPLKNLIESKEAISTKHFYGKTDTLTINKLK